MTEKSNRQLCNELIKDFEARKVVIENDKVHFNSTIGRAMQTGAIMALNDAITIIKKQMEKMQ